MLWHYADERTCKGVSIDVLYQGSATLAEDPDGQKFLTVSAADTAFSVCVTGYTRLCGQELMKTEQGRLYLATRGQVGWYFEKSTGFYAQNLDLTACINSKFLYVTTMIRQNV